MNADRLLQHFDRISEAPDAIPLLRRFILDLAVRGKIVPQNPNDEPAAELLKWIEAEKAKLMTGGKVKKKPISFDKEDVPFPLPSAWIWAHFVEVAAIESNLVKPENFPNHPHIAPDNIESRTGRLLDYQTIRQSKVFSAKHRFFPGHIVYSKIRPNLAKATLVAIEGLCSADMYPIRPFIDPGFLLSFMLSDAFVQQSIKEDNRVAMPKINQDALSRILVAVPPLAEQHRIVAKVDELMALCDQLEAAKDQREESRDRLVAASLHGLGQPADGTEDNRPEAFRDHARFTFAHFSHLTTRGKHIKQLRQTILNLAVRGKLVPQDPNDEPVSELLKRIQAEKKKLVREGKIRKGNEYPLIKSDEAWFPISVNWNWVRLGAIANVVMGQSPPGNTYNSHGEGVPLINGPVEFSEGPFGKTTVNQYTTAPTKFCEQGDLLLCVRGSTTGRTNIAACRACIGRGVAAIQPFLEDAYLRLFIWNRRESIIEMGRGIAFPSISRNQIEELAIPLPPLAEQQRIVAKVDELMALCDQLEAQLNATETDSRRLLEAVLHEALAPAL